MPSFADNHFGVEIREDDGWVLACDNHTEAQAQGCYDDYKAGGYDVRICGMIRWSSRAFEFCDSSGA